MNISKYLFGPFTPHEALTLAVTTLGPFSVLISVEAVLHTISRIIVVSGALAGVFGTVLLAMLLRITSRKQEVVILRVLGAKRRDILNAILLRSIALGALGVGLGVGFGLISNHLLQAVTQYEIVWFAALSGLAASLSAGAVAGASMWQLKMSEVIRS